MPTFLLPGDAVPEDDIPHHPKRKLALGPGLRFTPPTTVTASVAGLLSSVRQKKNTMWVDSRGGRYTPSPADPVICRVSGSAGEAFVCHLSAYTPSATLSHLAFENVTKKTKPNLNSGALVYARIASTAADLNQLAEPELTCVNSSTARADGLGPLKGGALFEISLGMARRLLVTGKRAAEIGQVVLLDKLGEKWQFEIAVGRNGLVWVDAAGGDCERTCAIGNAIIQVDDMALTMPEQADLAEQLLSRY